MVWLMHRVDSCSIITRQCESSANHAHSTWCLLSVHYCGSLLWWVRPVRFCGLWIELRDVKMCDEELMQCGTYLCILLLPHTLFKR
jgi:hypothetical protein